ncbi:MAG: hypothetical protein JO057_27240, partial [Chloroflexi bacterium]|nr:hypothetical protein [Chloroflexota bacterium]
VTLNQALVVLAEPGAPIVRVSVDDTSGTLPTIGQQASIELDTSNASATPITGHVTAVTPAAADGSTAASADLQVDWPDGQSPHYGLPVEATIDLQDKDGVLVVPVAALHTLGNQTTVEVLNGTMRKFVTVQVGTTNATSAEIVSGLTEGQMVVVPTTP